MQEQNQYTKLAIKLFKSQVVALRTTDPNTAFKYLPLIYQIYETEKEKRNVSYPFALYIITQGLPTRESLNNYFLWKVDKKGIHKETSSPQIEDIVYYVDNHLKANEGKVDFSLIFFNFPLSEDEDNKLEKALNGFLHEFLLHDRYPNLKNIVLVSNNPKIPKIAEKITTKLDFPKPSRIEREAFLLTLLDTQIAIFGNEKMHPKINNLSTLAVLEPQEAEKIAKDVKKKVAKKVESGEKTIDKLVDLTAGLTLKQVEEVVSQNAIWEDEMVKTNIRGVIESKEVLIGNNPSLELYHPDDDLPELIGFERALQLTQNLFEKGNPKGVLLVGVPGMGKSLFAKTIAKMYDVPTVFFNVSRIYGKYVGESEERMEDALKTIDELGTCIVVIDEIDKAMGGDVKDDVSERIFGMLHTWLQERKSKSFIIATANDISKLPKSLFRAGRWNATFFVGYYPSEKHYEKLINVYKERYEVDKKLLDLPAQFFKENRFTGAEMDATIEMAKILDKPVSQVLKEGWIKPLSQAEPEEIEKYLQFGEKYPNVHSKEPIKLKINLKPQKEVKKKKRKWVIF